MGKVTILPETTKDPISMYLFTMDLTDIDPKFQPISEEQVKFVEGLLKEVNKESKVTLFDVYKGRQIADGKKSISYSIVMRSHDGTLNDEQADNAMKKVLKAARKVESDFLIVE